MQITIIQKSITSVEADAIVNAANEHLYEGGGVCGAIFKAAGSRELTQACRAIGHCDTGSAVITGGFHSKAEYIIHAVGPVWEGGSKGERRKLNNAYKRALELAVAHGCHSVAFPLISSGIFGYPKEEAWEVALGACLEFGTKNPDSSLQVIFTVTSDAAWNLGNRTLKRLQEKRPLNEAEPDQRPALRRVLCFGDSLTWGYDPVSHDRLGEKERWTGVMREKLGNGWRVIEEGQNGRTIAAEDPAEGEKNGLTYLLPCLESQSPLDAVILMLGTNDCKRKFGFSSADIAREMQRMLQKLQTWNRFSASGTVKVLLVSPPHIGEEIRTSWLGDVFGYEKARELSLELAERYQTLAEMYGCSFVDAAGIATVSPADGCHMDAENHRRLGEALADAVESLF